MASLKTPVCEFGWKAKDFNLLSTDGSHWSPSKALGEKGLVIMFICNHCPYVKAILDRLITDINELKEIGVNTVAISSNDVENYPDDSYENMQKISSLKKIEQLFNSSIRGLSPGGTHLRIFVMYVEFNFNPSCIFLEKD